MEKFLNFLEKRPFLVSLGVFLFAFVLRVIKAGFFPLNHDEMITVVSSVSFGKAIEQSHGDLVPPFLNVVNVIFQKLGSGSIFWQRFPMVLSGALAVLLFYELLKHFQLRKPLLLALIPAISFILVFYSQELRPYSYVLLLSLATLYFGWKVLIEDKYQSWEVLFLATGFLLLPIIHYFAFFHLIALDLTLLIFILLLASAKIKKILTLLLLNLFSFLILIPWADVVSRNFNESKDASSLGKITRLDWALVKDIFYKFSGGAQVWSIFVFLIIIGSFGYLIFRLTKSWRGKNFDPADLFALFSVLYLAIFLIGFSRLSFGRFIFWRYLLFLIWPFFILLLYGLSELFEGKGIWPKIGGVILGLILASNIINTFVYLLAPNRFTDWRSIAKLSEGLVKSGQKNKIILHNFGNVNDLKFYLQDKNISLENITTPATTPNPRERMQEQLACCWRDIIYIHIREQGKESPENKILEQWSDKVFPHKIVVGQSKYLDFLDQRKVNPYWGYPFGFGGYSPLVIFY